MAIRIRTVELDGERIRVALCAAETDEMPDDVYLDDSDHYALAAKFCRDWQGNGGITNLNWQYPEQWAAMDTQQVRTQEQLEAERQRLANEYTDERRNLD